MDFKKLENAQKAYDEIKKLDAEIIVIEKVAMVVAQNKTEIIFKMSVEDLEKKPKKDDILDGDGSLKLGDSAQSGLFVWFGGATNVKEPEKDVMQILEAIPDTTALQVLGVLMNVKQERRKQLIDYMNKIMA
jgi:hypothetical protein